MVSSSKHCQATSRAEPAQLCRCDILEDLRSWKSNDNSFELHLTSSSTARLLANHCLAQPQHMSYSNSCGDFKHNFKSWGSCNIPLQFKDGLQVAAFQRHKKTSQSRLPACIPTPIQWWVVQSIFCWPLVSKPLCLFLVWPATSCSDPIPIVHNNNRGITASQNRIWKNLALPAFCTLASESEAPKSGSSLSSCDSQSVCSRVKSSKHASSQHCTTIQTSKRAYQTHLLPFLFFLLSAYSWILWEAQIRNHQRIKSWPCGALLAGTGLKQQGVDVFYVFWKGQMIQIRLWHLVTVRSKWFNMITFQARTWPFRIASICSCRSFASKHNSTYKPSQAFCIRICHGTFSQFFLFCHLPFKSTQLQ